jgi:dGTPase
MSGEVLDALGHLRLFLFERVYRNQTSLKEFRKAESVLLRIRDYVLDHPEKTMGVMPTSASRRNRLMLDFIAGMTDRYAIELFEEIAVPRPWVGLS